ncbi:MAG: radical SAM/SPASM domain-containing protein [Candidatus Hydrogenedentota bacterium]
MKTLPRFIQIETNIFCNARCPFCPTEHINREPKIMDEKVFKKIVDETRGKGICYRPFLQNEPLTDKRLPEFIKYIKEDNTALTELNSNGELLTEEWGKKLIEAKLDLIRFSVDGISQETIDIARPGLNYKLIEERLIKFSELVKKSKSSMKLIIRMIDMDINKHEQAEFKRFWSKYFDDIKIVPLYTWPWHNVNECVLKPCVKILEEMFFITSGEAVLCCWDTDARAVIGDVKKQSVSEIWNGEPNQTYRKYLAKGRRDKILLCSKCDAYKDREFTDFNGPDYTL